MRHRTRSRARLRACLSDQDLHQDYAGVLATSGCAAYRRAGWLPRRHSEIVERWLGSGAVIFGRTNSPEFGAKGITEPTAWGATRNPWDVARSPGGIEWWCCSCGCRRHRGAGGSERRRWFHSHSGGGDRIRRAQARQRTNAERARRRRGAARGRHEPRAVTNRPGQRRHARCHARSRVRKSFRDCAAAAAVQRGSRA